MQAQQDQTFLQYNSLKQSKTGLFQFVGPSYQSMSYNQDLQETMNLFVELDESGAGKNKLALYGTPGLTTFANAGSGPSRGLFPGENRLFTVSGPTLYEVFQNGTVSSLGTISNDGQPVYLVFNGVGSQIVIASGDPANADQGFLYCDSGSGPVKIQFTIDYTDLAIDASNNLIVTSAAEPFDGSDVGKTLVITGGSGFTFGTYTIVSVSGLGAATLSAAAGTVGSVGGIGVEYLGFVPAVQVVYLDTFFIAQAAYNSRLFYISSPDDGTAWDATQVATKESYPDNIAAMIADHEELWLFGSEVGTEGWHNAGASPFPLVRDDNAFMHFGIEAPFSVSRFMLGFAWISMDERRGGRFAFYAQGFQPIRISNHAVEAAWASYSTVKDCISYPYIENGHPFLVYNFPTANATWVYDGLTEMWHQRGWWNGASIDRQRQAFHAWVDLGSGAQHYVSDWETGAIYVQSLTTYTDAGTQITRIRVAPHISDEQTLNFYHRFQLDLQTGGGTLAPVLDWSDDGGHTFGNYNQTPSLGTPGSGQYGYRVIWTPLGSSRDRVFKVTITDAQPVAIVNA